MPLRRRVKACLKPRTCLATGDDKSSKVRFLIMLPFAFTHKETYMEHSATIKQVADELLEVLMKCVTIIETGDGNVLEAKAGLLYLYESAFDFGLIKNNCTATQGDAPT